MNLTQRNRNVSRRIDLHKRIISTIHKKIVRNEFPALTKHTIRINQPLPLRVVIPAPEPIQPSLLIVDIPTIPERIKFPQRTRHGAGAGQQPAPCIIVVFNHINVVGVNQRTLPLNRLAVAIPQCSCPPSLHFPCTCTKCAGIICIDKAAI